MNPTGSMYLIDAHALIYQMFHAIPPMSSADGRPTNAVFGVVRDLMWLHQEVKPAYLLCAFDLPAPTFRDAIDPDYKKHRPPAPPDLPPQISIIHEVLTAMNLPILGTPGYEADDVMATVAKAGEKRGLDVFICTSDKDCRQLIDDRIRIYNLRKREAVDRDGLMKIWGVKPEQVVDFQTLVGDSIDNVPGVPGIGEKTAAKLLTEYGSLDELVKNVDKIKQPKMRENLQKFITSGQLKKTRSLVRLEVNAPVEIDWDGWCCREWDGPKLLELFQALGFRSFANQVRLSLKSAGAAKNEGMLVAIGESGKQAPARRQKSQPADLFSDIKDDGVAASPPGSQLQNEGWDAKYTLVDTPAAFKEFLAELKNQKRFCFDLETTHLDPLRAEIVGLSFSWHEGTGYYVPVLGPEGDKFLDSASTLKALKPIFADPKVLKLNQNIKYDLLALRSNGVEVKGVSGDPMIAHYLLDAGARSHSLDDLTQVFLQHQNISITSLIGKGKNQKGMNEVPVAQVCDYAAEDADASWRLAAIFEPKLEEQGLKALYDDVEIPLIEVLAEMEYTGVRLDLPFLKNLSIEMEAQLQRIEKQIHDLVGHVFNISSPKQLREVLFDQLKLPVQKRTTQTNEASTDQETLDKLARLDLEKYPQARVAVNIVEHRQISKLKGTYVDALPALVNEKTGRVHTSFNQTIAETGRLSSSDPNLQNIPIRTEQGQQIRKAFIPREGWLLMSADYSQVELRLLAHFAKDDTLKAAFAEDRDIHAAVASGIYKVPLEQVTDEQRRRAKTINFGVLYGMSAFGLGERLNIPRNEAEAFIDDYFARYPTVLQYQENLLRECREKGYVSTILGRRRHFSAADLSEKSHYRSRRMIDRQAINMEIQGSAADMMKLALLRVHRRMREEKRESAMLLTVHDELVFEVPPDELQPMIRLVREEMEGAVALDVPLRVDVAVGPNWLDAETVK